ncbi:uncharacterized protein [Drosophila takahashii]|uniref:uncharacterized protein n=1 Tax=Drosophila takahashii TaxID=29030 RepID=UPI00389941AF
MYKCRMCHKGHPLRVCAKFIKLSILERRRAARRMGYCSNCLATTHRVHQCDSKEVCHKCGDLHHTLLHHGYTTTEAPEASKKEGRQPRSPRKDSSPPSINRTVRASRSKTRNTSERRPPRRSISPSQTLRQLQEAIKSLTKLKTAIRQGGRHVSAR